MLTVPDIVALAKSGFTAEQISKLAAHESRSEKRNVQEQEKEPEKAVVPTPAPVPTPVPAPVPTPAPVPNPVQMDATAQKLDSILALMQEQNLRNAVMPKQETAEDIIAQIINPNVNGGK